MKEVKMDQIKRDESVAIAIEIAIKLGILAIILFVSFLIFQPFLGVVIWSVILAVSIFPIVQSLTKKLNTTRKKVLIVLAVTVNAALIVPTYMVSDQAIEVVSKLSEVAKSGDMRIPPPTRNVKEWPLIGESTYAVWEDASQNFEKTLQKFAPQVKSIASKGVYMLGDTLMTVLFTMAAFTIAVFLMMAGERYGSFYTRISKRLIGERGEEWARLTALTIRSVANGVIGVAVIQATFAFAGMLLYGFPFAILFAVVIMFLTIIQLPTLIVIGPMLVWAFSQESGTATVVFAIYMVLVGAMDGVLKPLLMGRGVDIPMLVVLIGAIGGMMLMGMIGLFVGAVVFALAYKLFMLWLDTEMAVQEGPKN